MLKKSIKFLFSFLCGIALISLIIYFASCIKPGDLDTRVKELSSYCASKGCNTNYGILVDYGRCSIQKRLFLVDLQTGKIIMRSLCGHGFGGKSTILKAEFSNIPGSNCSSLGHYRVGRERRMYNRPAVSIRLPMAFELDGLDKTNSNARSRYILIHESLYPMSEGCITLPINQYNKLSKFLHTQKGSIIMWAYQ